MNNYDKFTDLEVIKENLKIVSSYGLLPQAVEIFKHAEIMAEQIKIKDGALTFALLEVDRLKAELGKRPETIQCGECKHWHPIEPLENNYSPMRPQGPCMIRKDNTYFYENDFCSHGQHRESEEK